MDDYRINTRFNLKDEAERSAADYLKSLGRKRNQFIVQAVIAKIEENNSKDSLLESIRQIFREEVQTVSVVSQPVPSVALVTELTEEQKEKNAKNVLADLELFG
jgi:membrane-bound lytic murein transglycosylase B